MNELDAVRLKLKCLEIVEGTKLKWWEVIKCNGQIPYAPTVFSGNVEYYELALGIVEGSKPVWEGDELYTKEGAAFIVRADTRFCSSDVSWNPPKPKTVMVELRVEDLEYLCAWRNMTSEQFQRLADEAKKALENLK